jgi:ABC-type antimicrobial peptide transport system permease subunit
MTVLRVLLVLAVSLLGWLVGGFLGGMVGFGIDLLLIATDWTRPPPTDLIPTAGMVGSILGLVVPVTWLASRVRRKRI